MGFSKATFSDLISDPDLYNLVNSDHTLILPNHAAELYQAGYPEICAIDFYESIFGEDLAPHREREDYQTGEYCGIVIEKSTYIGRDGKEKVRGKRYSITQGLEKLYDVIDGSEGFVMLAPISYAGLHRSNANARYLYALCIEIDDLRPNSGLKELIYSWERSVSPLPKPTYIVCSGGGVHLYYVFRQPIPLWKNIFESLRSAKGYLTKRFWNQYVTTAHEKIQYEAVNQAFRAVGSRTKKGSIVVAFGIGEKVTLEYLNKFLPADKQIDEVYKSGCSLAQARKMYPEWYQRRIVDGKERGHYSRHEGIYYNWIQKISEGAVVGHRYNCLEALCALAVQCNIPPEQVEADCKMLAERFDRLTIDPDNHFTLTDVLSALQTYHNGGDQAYLRRLEYISAKTGIPLQRAKRNGRKQKTHLRLMRNTLEILNEDYGRSLQGRSAKAAIVQEWRQEHPRGRKADCIRDTGLSKPTVYKWWDYKHLEDDLI